MKIVVYTSIGILCTRVWVVQTKISLNTKERFWF